MRQRKRLLAALVAALAIGIIGAVAALAMLPLEVSAPTTRPAESAASTQSAFERVLPRSAYDRIGQRDLRKALFDTPAATPAAPPPPKLDATLTGTVVDANGSYGIFRDKGGRMQVVSVGEKIAGATVTAVADDSATLEFQGQVLTLKVESRGGR